MRFIDIVLQKPSYGWCDKDGALIIPSAKQLFAEAFTRVNIFSTKKNWISLINWFITLCMMPFFLFFIIKYFSLWKLIASFLYGTIIMATHATVWYHRYCTHRAFTFSNSIWKIVTRNLVIRTVPEEIYVISHHVHHAKSDMPGDPYNSKAGLLYCMLADINHQSISKNLTAKEYCKASNFLKHTGISINNYTQYLKWGTVTNPLYIIKTWLLNWAWWYSIFYLIGGHGLSCAMFSAAMLWFILVRAFNYTGHGNGKEKHVDGIDFDRRNLSINQLRPGLVCGEWHNNHHLYPTSARAGFLPFQIDISWFFIFMMYKLGVVISYKDNKKDFLRRVCEQRSLIS